MLSDVPTGPLTLHFSLWCQVSYQQAEVFRERHFSMESAGNNWSIHAPETLVNASHTSPQLPLAWAPNASPYERKLGKGGLEWISKVRIYFANSTKIRWPCEHHPGPWETPVQKWRGWLWFTSALAGLLLQADSILDLTSLLLCTCQLLSTLLAHALLYFEEVHNSTASCFCWHRCVQQMRLSYPSHTPVTTAQMSTLLVCFPEVP